MVALLSLLAAALTFVEYSSQYPSLVEFRDAQPFNRTRFGFLAVIVLMLTLITRSSELPFALGSALTGLGHNLGGFLDFPFSPVRLVVLYAEEAYTLEQVHRIRDLSALAYVTSLVMLGVVAIQVRFFDWPIANGAFNFWVNLPLFDPTAGGDVLRRLKRDSSVNVVLGFLLPFLLPAVAQVLAGRGVMLDLSDPQTLIWMVSAWAFLPASLIMRGVALMRIADLIEEKRRRAYQQAELQAA